MRAWRVGLLLVLAAGVALPLAWPLVNAIDPAAWPAPSTWPRLAVLARNTLALIAGVLALALPAGVLLAVFLERTDVPGRLLAWGLLLAPLALPLPLWLSGWLLFGGSAAPLEVAERLIPWLPGLGPAVLFHALAGLPWVALIVAWGLRAGGEQEEAALTVRGPWWVLWNVTLPRATPAVLAAALWLAVLAAGEITITDLFQLRTVAEEVYTQHVAPEPGGHEGRAALAAFAWVLPAAALACLLLGRSGPEPLSYRPPPAFRLGAWRWPVAGVLLILAGGPSLAPLMGLAWRAGGSASVAAAWRDDGGLLACSALEAILAGLVAALLALVCAWLSRDRAWLRVVVVWVAAVAWVTPGPVLGLALKGIFRAALEALAWPGWLRYLVWDGPSYFPVGWAAAVRAFPFALALLLPAVRRIPAEVVEAARLDGAGPWRELTRIVWPLVMPAWLAAWGAAALLSLGELSAGKLVSTPGAETFAEMVFSQLHYGVTPDLAGRCILLAAVALAGGAALGVVRARASGG